MRMRGLPKEFLSILNFSSGYRYSICYALSLGNVVKISPVALNHKPFSVLLHVIIIRVSLFPYWKEYLLAFHALTIKFITVGIF